MTLNLIFVANTILVPLDEVYVGFFLAKVNSKTGWQDMSVGGRSDLRRSLFFFVSLILCL